MRILFTILTLCLTAPIYAQKAGEEHVVTNAEYRKFVLYVRDSLARKILGEEVSRVYNMSGNPDRINWEKKIVWEEHNTREALSQIFYPEHEQYNRVKLLDTRKLRFEYRVNGVKDIVNIYPDTLVWMRNCKDTIMLSGRYAHCSTYNWHPYYDEHPVMGLNDSQRKAYLFWLNYHRAGSGIPANEGVEYVLSKEGGLRPGEEKGLTNTIAPSVIWDIPSDAYKYFIDYCRDSLAKRILGENVDLGKYFIMEDPYGEELDPPKLKKKAKIKWDGEEESKALAQLYLKATDAYTTQQKIDVRYLIFEYYVIDQEEAAKPGNMLQGSRDRSVFIIKDIVGVYPDTALWRSRYFPLYTVKLDVGDPYERYPEKLKGMGIIYPSAKGFYIWTNRRCRAPVNKKKSPFLHYLFPSRGQWENMVQGKAPETIKFEIDYPDERFRYKVVKKSK